MGEKGIKKEPTAITPPKRITDNDVLHCLFMKIREKEWDRLLRNKKILYKSE